MKINDLSYNATGGEGKIAKTTVIGSEDLMDRSKNIYDKYFVNKKETKDEPTKTKK